ncbi:hypothetical protein M408DRAFT_299105 [Serendipita vermifera MAFF 305830]|uniref:Uncharacterized protein n=1 Tax=Serendipita vermifera MAFF 305830 TaxID=933852 RepID=A0A0C2WX19_SERVB|nr:hypothetical protein M408DRAFT_299105 [Serendipita vermifera MAFF 305830]
MAGLDLVVYATSVLRHAPSTLSPSHFPSSGTVFQFQGYLGCERRLQDSDSA